MFPGKRILALLVTVFVSSPALAVPVRVQVNGTVGFNVIGGGMANVPDGAPVSLRFNVNSTNFVNSPNFPTRGYPLDLASFEMTVGGVNVPIQVPQPAGGTAYFVLRNNDPAVDGFLLSTNVEFPQPVSVFIPGLAPSHELDFLRTFNDGTPLSSLDILDALGTYGTENLSSFNWTIGRFGNPGAEYNYQSISLAVVPEPSALVLLAAAAAAAALRR